MRCVSNSSPCGGKPQSCVRISSAHVCGRSKLNPQQVQLHASLTFSLGTDLTPLKSRAKEGRICQARSPCHHAFVSGCDVLGNLSTQDLREQRMAFGRVSHFFDKRLQFFQTQPIIPHHQQCKMQSKNSGCAFLCNTRLE